MKILWMELRMLREEPRIEKKNYMTIFDSMAKDGRTIARTTSTFYSIFRNDSTVRRCIEEIQQSTAKCGWELRKAYKNGNTVAYEDQEIDRAIKNSWGFAYFKNEIVKHLKISWNAYILKKRRPGSDEVNGWKVLDSRNVSIISDAMGNILKYKAKIGNVYMEFAESEIVHVMEYSDPDSPLFGMSAMDGIVYDVFGDEEAARFNYAFFKNDAIPSALYVLESGLEEEEQKILFERIKKELEGGINKHKALIAGGVSDVKTIGQNHRDAAFLEQRRFKIETVCAAFGVPKIMLGYTDSVNYSNAETQYAKFIENTIRPLEELLEEVFEILFSDISGVNVDVEIIDDHINDIDKRSLVARDNVNMGLITRNEAREFLGYERMEDPTMDEITIPMGTMLIDDLQTAGVIPSDEETEEIPT